ncbi:MAG: cell division protein FtsQ [Candidatus Omnitrophota bacterium]|jgi:cell division protein FtsQ
MAKQKRRKYKKRNSKFSLGALANSILVAIPYFFSIGLISLVIVGSYAYAMNADMFVLQDVVVLGDKPQVGLKAFNFAGLKKSVSTLDVDLDEVEAYIRRYHPEYQSVTVKRILPNRLVIEVAERIPAAQIKLKQVYWIDKEGVILNPISTPKGDFPIVLGIELKAQELKTGDRIRSNYLNQSLQLNADINKRNILKHYKLTHINLSDPRNLILVLDTDIEVRMGIRNLPQKLLMLEEAVASVPLDSSKIKYLDLRFDNIVVGPR